MTDVFTTLRIRFSGKSLMREGSQFESSTDIDAAVRAAIAHIGGAQEVAVVLSWVNGVTVFGRVELVHERHGGWSAHVIELCTQLERAPEVQELVGIAHRTRSRISLAAAQEHIAATIARASALGRRLRRST